MIIERRYYTERIERAMRRSPCVALLGPRQAGKTTLAHELAVATESAIFDLEDPRDLARLEEPMLALGGLRGLVVLDEVQRRPDLFPTLRVLCDRPDRPATFLVLGSASPELLEQSSESLAGRIAVVDLPPLSLFETGGNDWRRLWLRGGYPPAYEARDDEDAFAWLEDYVRTFVERDLRLIGERLSAATARRVLAMVAHRHGGTLNLAEIAGSLGVSAPTVARYLDALEGTFLIRRLSPWFENAGKRIVKSPKVYVRDSGLLHSLLGLRSREAVERSPKLGASWEGFALETMLRRLRHAKPYFWAAHGGGEVDLLLVDGERRRAYDFKWADAPKPSRAAAGIMAALGLERLTLVPPEGEAYPLRDGVDVMPLPLAMEESEP